MRLKSQSLFPILDHSSRFRPRPELFFSTPILPSSSVTYSCVSAGTRRQSDYRSLHIRGVRCTGFAPRGHLATSGRSTVVAKIIRPPCAFLFETVCRRSISPKDVGGNSDWLPLMVQVTTCFDKPFVFQFLSIDHRASTGLGKAKNSSGNTVERWSKSKRS